MKRFIAALLFVLVLPGSAAALETKDLVALAAMPLAVAAVADLADVPTRDLIDVVTAMNRAAVPAPQFIEVVRYVPVALVDQSEPRFVTYVTSRVDDGLTGTSLALALQDGIRTYGVTDIDVASPAVVFVDDNYLPPVVVSRFEPVRFNPVALVAMPLAVAAVAELTDVPTRDLISFVSLLNQAAVPAPQFVEVVRYVPVALVDNDARFLTFTTTEVDRGIIGSRLALSLADRIRLLGVDEIDVINPPRFTVVRRAEFIPAIVTMRVAEFRSGHPHGGPPGQLKKDLGVQTGAEIVHGSKPGKDRPRTVVTDSTRRRPVVVRDDDRGKPAKVKGKRDRVAQPKARDNPGRDRVKVDAPPASKPKPQGSQGKGGAPSNPGKSKGKGKG